MKRILLTTTSLVLAAGVAQADDNMNVSFGGTAGVALIDDNGASDETRVDMFFESYYDFDITASAESDNGVSVSVGFDMGAGNKIDYNDDDVLEAQGNTVGDADVAVSYNGWTLTVDQAGIDNLFDDTQAAEDVMISGSIAGWSVALTSDQEGSTSSYKVGGNVGGVALTFTGTDNDDAGGDATGISASYAMGDLTVSASMSDESNDAEDDTSVGFSYAMDALTIGYTTIKPGSDGSLGDEWDASVKYSAGGMVASFALDEADATTIIVDYALGGGASAFAAMHDKPDTASDLTTVGLNFAF
ncbi:porin [Planktomarina temperata]|nr:porin [Planktomarina temperata]